MRLPGQRLGLIAHPPPRRLHHSSSSNMTGQPDDVAAALQGPNVWLLAALLAAVLLVLGAHTGRSTGWGRP